MEQEKPDLEFCKFCMSKDIMIDCMEFHVCRRCGLVISCPEHTKTLILVNIQ